jgi:hypothetical protein
VCAAPAHASPRDSQAGQTITRSTVVARAMTWAQAQVPYSQTSYYQDYRQDCSGFLSMAWDLTTSAVSGDFVSSSSIYDTRLASWADLQPGDLLGIQTSSQQHVILFLGWASDDDGQHRYFDEVSESEPGTPTEVGDDQDALGYWKDYTPYRYDKIVAGAPAVTYGPRSKPWGMAHVPGTTLRTAAASAR